MATAPPQEPTFLKRIRATRKTAIERVKERPSIVVTTAIGAVIAFVATVVTNLSSIQAFFRPSEALSLAENTERDQMSRDITVTAWRRFFWANSYLTRVEESLPQAQQDEAWSKYIDATEQWDSKLMMYILVVDHFYGAKKSDDLENHSQLALRLMGQKLLNVRLKKEWSPTNQGSAPVDDQDCVRPEAGCRTPPQNALGLARCAVECANAHLYQFVTGFAVGSRK